MNTQRAEPNIADLINVNEQGSVEQSLGHLITSIRSYLDMDVAFISEFTSTHRIFRYVDAKSDNPIIKVGDSNLLEDSCCKKVVDCTLPQIIHNAAEHPEASKLEAVRELPLGAHISVPITLESGEVYGTFCCFSHRADQSLNERDLNMMRVFADLAAKQIHRDRSKYRQDKETSRSVQNVLNSDVLSIVYQPIYNIISGKIVGFECLSRFNTSPIRSPDVWFKVAAQVGLGVELELKAVQQALKALTILPDHLYVSVNISPETVVSGSIDAVFDNIPLGRVVLEVTEHAYVDQYGEFSKAISHLREKGLWLAVDDAGAGYASFRHILTLAPEVIKLDISIIRDIHTDIARRALTSAFVGFSQETNCKIVAEGVETALELQALKDLGVNYAQGYFLAKPMPIEAALTLLATSD